MTVKLEQIVLPEEPLASKYDFYFVCDSNGVPVADFLALFHKMPVTFSTTGFGCLPFAAKIT